MLTPEPGKAARPDVFVEEEGRGGLRLGNSGADDAHAFQIKARLVSTNSPNTIGS